MILLSNHSIEPSKDEYSSSVRGRVNAIFLFDPISSHSTRVINVLNVDLKGSIPRIVTNKMADMQLDAFALIKRKIEDYYNSVYTT